MQRTELIVTTPEAATALREMTILPHFLEPRSPSDVGKTANMPANLVHHHAKRAVELGLLLEVKREAGKVYYQLAARTFKHARDLLSVEDVQNDDLRVLTEAFVKAYLRSDHIAGHLDPDYATHGFAPASSQPEEQRPQFTSFPSPEAHPAHLQIRTLRLSSAGYLQLAQRISDAILETIPDSSAGSDACTFAFLAFDGAMREGSTDSHRLDSYLVLPNA
jgi:hypothetical protein